jgi:hypothetical protein
VKEPKTVAEQLDAAAKVPDQGQAFGMVINSLFAGLEKARNDDD